MSANNWRTCPRCLKAAIAVKAQAKQQCEEGYGKLTPVEYGRLLDLSQADIDLEETLREDYDIRTNDKGVFSISYHCNCQKCGLDFHHRFEQKLEL